MGGGKHSSIDRGNYLYHSENGKKLTPIERQKISLILKSLEENISLAIDPDEQKIIFTESGGSIDQEGGVVNHESRIMNQESRIMNQEKVISHQSSVNNFLTPVKGQKSMVSGYGTVDEQEDIFEKYSSIDRQAKAYSPNFAQKQSKLQTPENEKSQKESFFQKIVNPVSKNSNPEYPINAEKTAGNALSGSISFSSAQKFSGEKKVETPVSFGQPIKYQRSDFRAQTVQYPPQKKSLSDFAKPTDEQKPIAQTRNFSVSSQTSMPQQKTGLPQQANIPQQTSKNPDEYFHNRVQSQWQIRPRGYVDENSSDAKKEIEPKIKGNTVDLRNS
jgi:hypothetical protein